MSLLVELRQVIKNYGPEGNLTRALRGVDLDLESGEFTAMAGPSGSGKTTLLNIIGGLDRADGGEVFVEGQEISHLSGGELSRLRRDRIGFIFQTFNLIPVLTAMENAEYILLLQGYGKNYRQEQIRGLFEEVGLGGLEDRLPRELSGGQQQRVAVVRAIAPAPALVLADEPTANLDSTSGGALLDLLRRINEEKGITFLFSTHDPAVMQRARRLVHLKDGRILTEAPEGTPGPA